MGSIQSADLPRRPRGGSATPLWGVQLPRSRGNPGPPSRLVPHRHYRVPETAAAGAGFSLRFPQGGSAAIQYLY